MGRRRKPTRKQEHAAALRAWRKDGTYERLLHAQDGKCGICFEQEAAYVARTGRRMDVDHDHRTMTCRGVLCRGCNMKLRKGLDEQWLVSAAQYLRDAA